ncbi:hypothetical protein PTKIN_Ptkin01aG0026600 [Pterospermum kingtungense]
MSYQVIPHDIVHSILSWLPVKSLLRFQSVSKEWLSHIKQSIKTRNDLKTIFTGKDSDKLESLTSVSVYLDIPKELNSGAEIVGSCNGILCLHNRNQTNGSTIMWNISTKESKVLPDEPMEPYDESTTYDYYSANPPWFITEVKVYSLKTNSWRSCEQIPNYYFFRNYWGVQYHTFVCGALHWRGVKEIPWWGHSAKELVVAFDVATEKHHTIELPNGMEHKSCMALGAFQGCLCAIIENGFKVYIWVKKDYGVKESWTMMHCLQDQSLSVVYLKLLWYELLMEKMRGERLPSIPKETTR